MKYFNLLLAVYLLLTGCSQETVEQQVELDVRNVRWGMAMDEVITKESASWTEEPKIIEKNKDGGSTIIANVEVFEGSKALLIYEFEREPIDTLKLTLTSMEYKIFSVSDTEYQRLVLDFDMRHGKGDPVRDDATIWETKDGRTRIVTIRYDMIKTLSITYLSYITIQRQAIEKKQKMRRDF